LIKKNILRALTEGIPITTEKSIPFSQEIDTLARSLLGLRSIQKSSPPLLKFLKDKLFHGTLLKNESPEK
jgi:hypothetical protein